jgi:CRISPR-associated protein Cmr4
MNLIHFYLLSPLHTGGTTQEGNLVGIARESHTNLPYVPSSTIRGKIRSLVTEQGLKFKLFGNEIDKGGDNLEQGDIWIGDGSILWLPVPSLSHGVVWISSPMLLRRWANFAKVTATVPENYSCSFKKANTQVYLKDAILNANDLKDWSNWRDFVPKQSVTGSIDKVLVLPDQHCATLIQMSLWRQVKIKLDQHKSVNGGFRYEEAIPPDTVMYFPWGITSQANGTGQQSQADFKQLLADNDILQIGGQESLGRGFVQQW